MDIINTQLTADVGVLANGIVPLGETIHKCGCGLKSSNNSIVVKGSGYYKITASATIAPTGATEMTMTLLDNGSAIATASAVPASAGDEVDLNIVALVYKRCICTEDSLSFVLNSAGTVSEMDVIVEGM